MSKRKCDNKNILIHNFSSSSTQIMKFKMHNKNQTTHVFLRLMLIRRTKSKLEH